MVDMEKDATPKATINIYINTQATLLDDSKGVIESQHKTMYALYHASDLLRTLI